MIYTLLSAEAFTDSVLQFPSIITIIGFIAAAGGFYRYIQLTNKRLEDDIAGLRTQHATMLTELKELKIWGETQVAVRTAFNESHYLSIERFNECMIDVKRRLDDFDAIGLSARLARIEALLEQLIIEKGK